MALDDDIRILSGVKLFEGFTSEQLRLLAFGAETVTVPAGATIFREEDKADGAFMVVSGVVELYREEDGVRHVVGAVQSGALIGELALIAETHRLTGAEARASTTLLKLGRRTFRRILEEYPDTAERLYRRILDDFQTLVGRIEALSGRFSD
jgi:CRP-like cAMP-binding protein